MAIPAVSDSTMKRGSASSKPKKVNRVAAGGKNYILTHRDVVSTKELLEKEVEITAKKLIELYIKPINIDFGKEQLKAIHYYLFSDIYPFAGQYRNVYMQKNNSYFAAVDEIDDKLDDIFINMEIDLKNVYDKYSFACVLAKYYVLLLNVHPFREGNGRTIREFIREYANEKCKELPIKEVNFYWSNVDGDAIESIINKSLAYRSIIELEFLKALEEVEVKKGRSL